MCDEAGLVLWDVEELALHGGSLIARAKKKGATPKPSVKAFMDAERAAGYEVGRPGVPEVLKAFARGTERLKTAIPATSSARSLLKASASPATAPRPWRRPQLLRRLQGPRLEFVADRSPYKQGKLGARRAPPVVSPDVLRGMPPDVTVVLAWNFFGGDPSPARRLRARAGGVPPPGPRAQGRRSSS
ncbi:MAG: hypothetical protein U0235_14475 [Polyangiaceae bacterium]